MIIATTVKNCVTVRLSSDFQIDVEKVYYTVYCEGYTFEFGDFGPAARVYKNLSEAIENGGDVEARLNTLVKGARVLGFTVKEVA